MKSATVASLPGGREELWQAVAAGGTTPAVMPEDIPRQHLQQPQQEQMREQSPQQRLEQRQEARGHRPVGGKLQQREDGSFSPFAALRDEGGIAAFSCQPLHFFVKQHAVADGLVAGAEDEDLSSDEGAAAAAAQENSDVRPHASSTFKRRRRLQQGRNQQQEQGRSSALDSRNAETTPYCHSQQRPAAAGADARAEDSAQGPSAASPAAAAARAGPSAARESVGGRSAAATGEAAVAAAAPAGARDASQSSTGSSVTHDTAAAAVLGLATAARQAHEFCRLRKNTSAGSYCSSSVGSSSCSSCSNSVDSNSCNITSNSVNSGSCGSSSNSVNSGSCGSSSNSANSSSCSSSSSSVDSSSANRATANTRQQQQQYSLVRFEIHPAGLYVELPEDDGEDGDSSALHSSSSSGVGDGGFNRSSSVYSSSSSESSNSARCSSATSGGVVPDGSRVRSSDNASSSPADSSIQSSVCANGSSDPSSSSSSAYTQKLLQVLWGEGARRPSCGPGPRSSRSSKEEREADAAAGGRADACRVVAAALRGLTKEGTDQGKEEEAAAAAAENEEAEEGGGAREGDTGRCPVGLPPCRQRNNNRRIAAPAVAMGESCLAREVAAAHGVGAVAAARGSAADFAGPRVAAAAGDALLEKLLALNALTPAAAARLRHMPVSQWGETVDDMCQNDARTFYVRCKSPVSSFSVGAAACTGSDRHPAAAQRTTATVAAAAPAAGRHTGGRGGRAEEEEEELAAAGTRNTAAAVKRRDTAEEQVRAEQQRNAGEPAEQYVFQQRNGLLRVGISNSHPALRACMRKLYRPSSAADNPSNCGGSQFANAPRRKAAAVAVAEEGETQRAAGSSVGEGCGKRAGTATKGEEKSVDDATGDDAGETKHELYTEERRRVAPAEPRANTTKKEFLRSISGKSEAVDPPAAQKTHSEECPRETVSDSVVRGIRLEVRKSVLKNSISGKRKRGGILLQPGTLLAVLHYEEKEDVSLEEATEVVMHPTVEDSPQLLRQGQSGGERGEKQAKQPLLLEEEARQAQQRLQERAQQTQQKPQQQQMKQPHLRQQADAQKKQLQQPKQLMTNAGQEESAKEPQQQEAQRLVRMQQQRELLEQAEEQLQGGRQASGCMEKTQQKQQPRQHPEKELQHQQQQEQQQPELWQPLHAERRSWQEERKANRLFNAQQEMLGSEQQQQKQQQVHGGEQQQEGQLQGTSPEQQGGEVHDGRRRSSKQQLVSLLLVDTLSSEEAKEEGVDDSNNVISTEKLAGRDEERRLPPTDEMKQFSVSFCSSAATVEPSSVAASGEGDCTKAKEEEDGQKEGETEGRREGASTHRITEAGERRTFVGTEKDSPFSGGAVKDEEVLHGRELKKEEQQQAFPLLLEQSSSSCHSKRPWRSTFKIASKRRRNQENRRCEEGGGAVHAEEQEEEEEEESVKGATVPSAAAGAFQTPTASLAQKEQSRAGQWKQRQIRIYACAAGDLIEFNAELLENPRLLFDAPEREGWVVIIRPRRGWQRPPLQIQWTVSENGL